MYLARVAHTITATKKHEAYEGRKVFAVRVVRPDGTETGEEWVAMDYVGAGVGDTVVCGGAPGVAREVFELERAPIHTLIMAIVDRINCRDDV